MRPLARTRFTEGDALRAGDLRRALADEARRRGLHVRAAHRAAGVAVGFAVGVGRSRRGVVVGPGCAYDRRGRELVSGRTVFVSAPVADGAYDLVVSEGCGPEWSWLARGRTGDGVVLATFEVLGGQLGPPDLAYRASARAAGGRLVAGTQEAAIAPVIHVNTTAAGFQSVPYYFATIEGWPARRELVGTFVELRSPSPVGFNVAVRVGHRPASPWVAAKAKVTIHWLGVEMPARCAVPAPDTGAVASPADRADEYGTFVAVPPATDPAPT